MKRSLVAVIAVSLAAAIPVAAGAQSNIGFRGWGPRLGLSVNPDQFDIGLHADFGQFADHVRFQPNFELGFGDHETVGAFNAEADYRFSADWETWSPYLGGGLGLIVTGRENEGLFGDNSQTDVGLNAIGGLERGLSNGDRFFGEGKLGLANGPDFKFTIGWTFY